MKVAMFTDIHFGRRNNSDEHNTDCIEFIDWMINDVEQHGGISRIVFLGDWFQQRSSIAIETVTHAIKGMEKLNAWASSNNTYVDIIVGNHDLRYRNSRELYSSIVFQKFTHINVISEPVIVNVQHHKVLLSPYLFDGEYKSSPFMDKSVRVWMGHFEFVNFVIAGANTKSIHGADHTEFSHLVKIFSGDFHKRQIQDNVHYIGNTFPMDFSDANDTDRGYVIYDFDSDSVEYVNWKEGPLFVYCNFQDLQTMKITGKERIECQIDSSVTYEQIAAMRQYFSGDNGIRELRFTNISQLYFTEDTIDQSDVLPIDDSVAENQDVQINDIDSMVIDMMSKISVPGIDPKVLVQLYSSSIGGAND